MVTLKHSNFLIKLENPIKELNRSFVVDITLHQIEEEILKNYTADFEMIGTSVVGENLRSTHIRFRNIIEYENHFHSINDGCDSERTVFNG